MQALSSQIDPTADEFRANAEHQRALIAELEAARARVRLGGGEAAVTRHRARGKRLPRERIDRILDAGSPFLELSELAAHGCYHDEAPSAGIVTGIGMVHGRRVLFVANDATVKGGSYLPLTVKKHLRAQRVALENGLACVYLVDSGGAFLPLQDEVFPDREHFGRIFYHQALLSARGLPQLAAVLGSCTAGGAYVPAMSDETVIVKGNGTIFLGGPPLVKAATGEEVDAQDLGGADVHCRASGVSDHLAENEDEALVRVRDMIEHLANPRPAGGPPPYEPCEPSLDPAELLGIIPRDHRRAYDVREVIGRIVDASGFHEFKALYGPTLVCGFARIFGQPVGILANQGILFSPSALKGAHFVQLADQRGIPLIFLQNITGFMVGRQYEAGGIAKDGAKLVQAVSTARVPRLTVIIGGSFGAGNYGMCGRGYDPRFLWMWPGARISVMGAQQAASVLRTVKEEAAGRVMSPEERAAFEAPILEKYEREGSPYYATARLWDDGIITPLETRRVLGLALDVVMAQPLEAVRPPVYRM